MTWLNSFSTWLPLGGNVNHCDFTFISGKLLLLQTFTTKLLRFMGGIFLVRKPVKVKCGIWQRNVDTPVLVQREREKKKKINV